MRKVSSEFGLALLLVLPVACGSDDENAGSSGGEGDGGMGGMLFEDPNARPVPGAGERNGGTVTLTPEQVSAIQANACEGWAVEGEALPTALELVVDVSSSMNQGAPGTNFSKWDVTRDALIQAIPGDGSAQYPGLAAGIPVGLLFYPNVQGGSNVSFEPQDINNCVNTSAMVPIAPLGPEGAQQRTLLANSFEQVNLETGTPTYDAYTYAFNNGMLPFQFTGNRYMLLITDGTPTIAEGCSSPTGELIPSGVDPQPIVDAVAAAYNDHGIRTFVIGSPGSEDTRAMLSAAARVGGTQSSGDCSDTGVPSYCHMDMTEASDFSQALRDGLGAVVGQLKSCTYEFPQAPEGQTLVPELVNIIVETPGDEMQLILPDDTPSDCTVGFQLTADQQVVLCPESCTQVQSDPNTSIQLLFGCETGQILR